MKVSDAFPSEFLKAADIGQSQVKVLISHVELREMTDGENKPVVFFGNKKKGVILNVTNANAIAQYYGDDMDHWAILDNRAIYHDGKASKAACSRVFVSAFLATGEAAPARAPKPAPVQQSENPAMDDEVLFDRTP